MVPPVSNHLSEPTLRRICGEYLEMPGLRLTRRQAERLWGIDRETCAEALEFLVDAGFLTRIGDDSYVRRSGGPVSVPSLRMLKVSVEGTRLAAVTRPRAS